jgi:hypothetical protein
MELRSRRLAPVLFGALAFLVIATSPCTARASDEDEDDLDVPDVGSQSRFRGVL